MGYTLAGASQSLVFTNTGSGPVINSFKARRNSSVDLISWYLNAATDNIYLDVEGVVQTYSMEGVFAGSISNINSFITSMNAMLSGHQIDTSYQVTIQSTSSDVPYISSATHCVITNFEFEWTDKSMTSIDWAIDISIGKAPA
jgi:hypothetical protein